MLQMLAGLPPAGAAALMGLLGLMIGSFLNVVVHRLPRMMERQFWRDVAAQGADDDSFRRVFDAEVPAPLGQAARDLASRLDALPALGLARPGSRCPACGHAIRWHENIPVISWLVLRGRCSACGTPIGLRYPLVELLCGALFAAVGWKFGATPAGLMWAFVVAMLLALTFIDWDTTLLPDGLTLPLLWAGLAAAAWGATVPLDQAVWGAVVGYLSLWSVYWAFKLLTGKEGMGHGDFKLLAALGAWFGLQAVLPVILMSSVVGAVVGIALKLRGGLRSGGYLPFGPFLAGGGLCVLLIGSEPLLRLIGWPVATA